jgi:lipopolysaccharide heptosyltransferase II
MNKIRLLKFFDNIVGKPAVIVLSKLRKYEKRTLEKPQDFLFIRPGGIGDAVLLLPTIHALRESFPDSLIDVLCEKRNAEVFRLSKAVNMIYLYDKEMGLLQCMKKHYDAVIDTEQWHRLSAVVTYFTKAPIRIGFDTNERRKLFSHKIPYSHDDYEANSFLHLIEPLTGKQHSFNTDEPFIKEEYPLLSDRLPGFSKIDKKMIAIFPGSSVWEKRWGGDKFGKVARTLSEDGYAVVILGSQHDKEDAQHIGLSARGCHDLTGKTTLYDIAAILKKCRLLITADSGLLHIAYALGTPTVSLFGASNENKWAPKGRRHYVINKHLPCSPCSKFGYTPHCRIQRECLSSITVDEVIVVAQTILDAS